MQHRCFQDFDAFASSISGVESKMMLRNAKNRTWQLDVVDLDGLPVQLASLGSGNIARGELHADGALIYLPLTPNCTYTANGTTISKGSFAVLDPGSEFCVSTKVEHDWCSVTVPNVSSGPDLDGSSSPRLHVTKPDLALARQFRQAVHQVVHAATIHPQFESTAAAKIARAEIYALAQRIVGQSPSSRDHHDGRPRISREDIIRRVEAHLESHRGDRILVDELATAADVSERTLRSVFNDYYGLGPSRYLQLRQLHRIRRDLQAADVETTSVSDILIANGEWEFSRFASRYRRTFGELPSETLRN